MAEHECKCTCSQWSNFPGYTITFFVLIKFVGTGFAAWSWWWVLAAWVPVFEEVAKKLGMM